MNPIRLASPRIGMAFALALTLAACARNAAPIGPAPVPQPPATTEAELLGETAPPVEGSLAAAKRDILGSVRYDLPVEANNWVEAELDFLVGKRKEVIRGWMERGDFYEPWVKQVLRENGVPTDLYHLAMIESGFLPTARSHAGAVGMWQFMSTTAKGYGLRVDSLVDERMDPVRSTRAAARHLRGLNRMLRDWPLAAAAYNAGSGRISRGLKAYNATSYWDLAQRGDLAEETKRYVPRLYAVTVVARDRERFGFRPPVAVDRFAFDSIHIEYATPLEVLAEIGSVPLPTLKRLNPHLVGGATPAGGYWVWVPAGTAVGVQRAWLASDFRREQGYGSYTVRWGDNLGGLAEASGVRAARIRELNPAVDFDRLQTGAKLKLPYGAARDLAARPGREAERTKVAMSDAARETASAREEDSEDEASYASAAKGPGRTHIVVEGETLWAIARDNHVAVEEIQRLNDLAGATIRPGQTLRLPGAAPAEPVKKAAFADPVEHVVRPGESLWSIARKYGSSVEALQAANDLGDQPIQPGQKLRIR